MASYKFLYKTWFEIHNQSVPQTPFSSYFQGERSSLLANNQFYCFGRTIPFLKTQILNCCCEQPWELGKKNDSNFIFTFAVVKVRYDGITTTKFGGWKNWRLLAADHPLFRTIIVVNLANKQHWYWEGRMVKLIVN